MGRKSPKYFVTRLVSMGAAIVAVALMAGCSGIGSSSSAVLPTQQTIGQSNKSAHSPAVQTSDSSQTSTPAQDGNFDQNPTTKLPDSISSSVPDTATVVSRDYAQKKDGIVVSLKTGAKVTDPKIVGTQDTPPDPLAISGGKRFIPVSVSDTKKQMAEASSVDTDGSKTTASSRSVDGSSAAASVDFHRGATLSGVTNEKSDAPHVKTVEYQSNEYGAHWGTSGGQQAIYSRSGRRVLNNVLHGVDVSQFQNDINWGAAKNAGVQAAVVRLGYGYGNGADPKAAQNTNGVRKAGLKYGFYWYSYAYNNWFAEQEAKSLIEILHQYGVRPGSTALPIYYDLEGYSWSAHPHPTNPSVYRGIVQTWINTMRAAGYTNVAVYSYTSYLNSELNDSYIHSQTSWVAQYAGDLQYTFTTSHRSWQYADSGHINGIPGSVDLDAFDPSGSVDITKDQQITVPDGTYYIIPASNATASVDVPGASTADSTRLATYSANGTDAQRFQFTRNSDGSYTITNVHSGKVLDVAGAAQQDGTLVQQYTSNGTKAQRWYIRQGSTGAYYLQSALGNWALGSSGTAGNSTPLEIEMPQDVTTQRFLLSSPVSVATGKTVRIDTGLPAERVMDISGGSTANNAIVDSYSWNGTAAQQFVLTRRGNSVYSIQNVKSGKVVDVSAGGTANGTAVDQYSWNGTQAQLWVMRDAGNGYVNLYNPASGKMMEIPGASTTPGSHVKLYTANDTAAQKWRISVYTPTVNPTPTPKPETNILSDGIYRFESATNRAFVFEVAGARHDSGANVSLYQWNGTDAQKWRVRNLGGDVVTLTDVASGKPLDLVSALARNGQNVDQYASNGTKAQKWHVVRSGDAIVLRSAVNEGFAVDLSGNIVQNGRNVDIYRWNGTNAQKWYAIKVG